MIEQNVIEIVSVAAMNAEFINLPFSSVDDTMAVISDDNNLSGKIFLRRSTIVESAFLKQDVIPVIKLSEDVIKQINHDTPHITYRLFQHVAATVTQKNGYALCITDSNDNLEMLSGYLPNNTFGDLTQEEKLFTQHTINIYRPQDKEIIIPDDTSILEIRNTLTIQRNTFLNTYNMSKPSITHNETVLKTWASASMYKSQIIDAVKDIRNLNKNKVSSKWYPRGVNR